MNSWHRPCYLRHIRRFLRASLTNPSELQMMLKGKAMITLYPMSFVGADRRTGAVPICGQLDT